MLLQTPCSPLFLLIVNVPLIAVMVPVDSQIVLLTCSMYIIFSFVTVSISNVIYF